MFPSLGVQLIEGKRERKTQSATDKRREKEKRGGGKERPLKGKEKPIAYLTFALPGHFDDCCVCDWNIHFDVRNKQCSFNWRMQPQAIIFVCCSVLFIADGQFEGFNGKTSKYAFSFTYIAIAKLPFICIVYNYSQQQELRHL